jgi:LytR cell envelope-related transcriptional attenuator
MEHAHDLVRPWRRATIAVSAVAAIELIALAGIGMALLGNPLARHLRESAAAAGTPRHRAQVPARPQKTTLQRSETSVIVLNGNGRAGSAHAAASRVQALGYLLGDVGNASALSPRTIVMYRPGYVAEGARLAHDLHVRIARPLDGMRPAQLMGAHLVLVIGT